jgi:hypothetical protein
VYRFHGVATLVEPFNVAVMWTDPVPAGLYTEHELGDVQFITVAVVLPNFTVMVGSRPAPLITTACPPVVGPTAGVTPMIDETT